MLYLLAVICPPLAVAMATEGDMYAGRKVVLNLALTVLLCWLGGVVHAALVVSER